MKIFISICMSNICIFIHSRIKYRIEDFGDCANEYLQKLQVIQNKLVKLLLNLTAECLLRNYISNCLCWKWLISILLMCCHLLMNADLAGVQLCSQAIIMYEKQGTNSDRMIVSMWLWQEPISVKVLTKSKVPGYRIISSTWFILICIQKASERLPRNTLLKLITKFVTSYNILCTCFAIVMISYLSAPCCIIRL